MKLKLGIFHFGHADVFLTPDVVERYNRLLETGVLAANGLVDGETKPALALGVILDNALRDLETAAAKKQRAHLATPSPTDASSAGADLRAEAASSQLPGAIPPCAPESLNR